MFTTHSSGDTGVSASLILHGTPPFQVYYRTQRDQEAPKDLVKTFANSRGELTLQPERSGHYVYSFIQMSDANYKQIELNGPSIDQVVHPLAAAEFANANSYARSRVMINSCSGNMVDVDVDLRVRLALDIFRNRGADEVNRAQDLGTLYYRLWALEAQRLCRYLELRRPEQHYKYLFRTL